MEGSQRLADELLPRHGFSQDNVEEIKRIIRNSFAGRMETVHDKILHDSRYDYLGRVDYVMLTGKLRKELAEHGIVYDDANWKEQQARLLNDHLFVTDTAKILRNVTVESQIMALNTREE
jgi:hypothetical protein